MAFRDGDAWTGRWTIRDSGLEIGDSYGFVAFDKVATLSFPESMPRRVGRGVVAGAVLAGAATATADLAGADARDVMAIASPTGLALGVLYGLVVPSQRTIYFGKQSRIDLMLADPSFSSIVLLRISP